MCARLKDHHRLRQTTCLNNSASSLCLAAFVVLAAVLSVHHQELRSLRYIKGCHHRPPGAALPVSVGNYDDWSSPHIGFAQTEETGKR